MAAQSAGERALTGARVSAYPSAWDAQHSNLSAMLDRLYDLSDVWVFLLFASAAVIAFAAAPRIGRRLGWTAPDRQMAEHILRALTGIASFTAVILSFSLVQVNGHLRNTEELVGREARQIDHLDRLLLRYASSEAKGLRQGLRAYAASIVHDEFTALRGHHDSPRTGDLLRQFSRDVLALDPAQSGPRASYANLQEAVDSVSDLRDQRLTAAELVLPATFWYLILSLILMMVVLSGMLDPGLYQTLSIGAIGLSLVLLAALVFTVETPFKGEIAVIPKPIEQAIERMAARG